MQFQSLLNKHSQQWRFALFIASLFIVVICFFSLTLGETLISIFTQDPFEQKILLSLRLPRLIAALLIGASLAVCGASLQALLENPLAEPGVLGISGGSSLALVLLSFALPTWVNSFSMMLAALIGALAFTFILVFFARLKTMTTAKLLLIGVALGILSSALITWAFYFSSDLNLRQLMYWLMGNLSGINLEHLSLSLVIIPALFWLCLQGNKLDILLLGELQAKQLGLDTNTLRWQLILLVSLLVASSVAMAGIIGFIGLIVPHLLRLWFGAENKYLLPLSAICGAGLLALADLIARISLSHSQLPVGAVISLLGAPLFIWILLRRS